MPAVNGHTSPRGAQDRRSPESEKAGKSANHSDTPIVLACDERFAMPLTTTLRSLVESNRSGRCLDLIVLTSNLSVSTRRKALESLPPESVSIRWLPVDLEPFGQFSTPTNVSRTTYARLLVPHVVPKNVARALYLDADLLVLDDLGSLLCTDLEGAVLGAVLDELDAKVKAGEEGFKEVPSVRNYFNGGVLLFDLDRWRAERISEQAIDYLSSHPTTRFADQDALNVVCDGRWKQLDPRWNHQNHSRSSLSDMTPPEKPGIVHFVTAFKPWDASALSCNADFYDAFRSRTRFARSTPEQLLDAYQAYWARVKAVLRRYGPLHRLWSRLKSVLTRKESGAS